MSTTPAESEKAIARKFNTANPIGFDFYNQDDERVLFITDDDKQLQTLTLELTNTSPRDIEFQTPDTEPTPVNANGGTLQWADWVAGKDLYHLQLSFRPGVLSEKAKGYLKHPAYRLAALGEGWDLQYDPDPTDLTDWVSLLWLGEDHAKKLTAEIRKDKASLPVDLDAVLKELCKAPGSVAVSDPKANGLAKQAVRKLVLAKLSAGAGGGARGTRIHLNYQHLVYQDRKEVVPAGTRTQFLNIINHSGKAYIPLHVGFVGSNTVLNDQGRTANELTLRITNISNSDSIKFRNSPASRFTISFDIDDAQAWALTKTAEAAGIQIEWDGSPKVTLTRLDASRKQIELTDRDQDSSPWKPDVRFQGERPSWSFTYTGKTERTLGPGQSIELKLSELKSSSPAGYTNLYLHYEDIPGYWDGQVTCLIEKAPLVYRGGDVGIGTDMEPKQYHGNPTSKLHVDVSNDNASLAADKKKPAAVFEGGNVGIGTKHPKSKLAVTDGLTIGAGWVETHIAQPNGLLVEGKVGIGATAPNLHLAVGDDNTGLHQPGAGALAIHTAGEERMRIGKDGKVGIGTESPASKLAVTDGLTIGGNSANAHPAPPNGLLVEGNVGIGTGATAPTHALHIAGNDEALRLTGTKSHGHNAKLAFGDADYVYLHEDKDDHLTIHAREGLALTGGPVTLGTELFALAGVQNLRVIVGSIEANGDCKWGEGFGTSNTRTSQGRYKITFVEEFKEAPVVVVTQVGSLGERDDNCITVLPSKADSTISIADVSSDAKEYEDTSFNFIAIGLR